MIKNSPVKFDTRLIKKANRLDNIIQEMIVDYNKFVDMFKKMEDDGFIHIKKNFSKDKNFNQNLKYDFKKFKVV